MCVCVCGGLKRFFFRFLKCQRPLLANTHDRRQQLGSARLRSAPLAGRELSSAYVTCRQMFVWERVRVREKNAKEVSVCSVSVIRA